MSEGLDERPRCPDHPDKRPVNARKPATLIRRWVCLVCGRELGEAPEQPGDDEWEAG